MSPVYLNPQSSSPIPFIDLKGDNNQHQNTFQVFGYLHGGDHLCTNNSSFNSKEMLSLDYTRHDQVKVEKLVLTHDKASDLGQPCSPWLQSGVGEDSGSNSYTYSINNVEKNQKNQSVNNNDHKYTRKWKSSKVKIMQKMMTNSKNSRDGSKQQLEYDLPKRQINDGIRVCTDCHTTTTPLWRSGPQGPKSLCNACGIRQRKARRAAMAAAAAEAAATGLNNDAMVTSSMPRVEPPKPKIQVKKTEKVLDDDKNHTLLPLKKRSKIINANRNDNINNNNYHTHNSHNNNSSKKLCFENFAMSSNKDYLNDNSMRSFPQDEEEGAILLMALSCGLACCSF